MLGDTQKLDIGREDIKEHFRDGDRRILSHTSSPFCSGYFGDGVS
jgi:hypothetical protein